ncbi:MAG: class I SAM-dependent methyltransferase [SAR324 cluster bacterium]|uniref:Class I SAM-dependent methyltransferase n=1 Tax=SAR324 cluster bacterium TaxID=2024889 RepID=A0A7X9FS56_9DELT|nr:class I SAM-dependent methyltransferase [SAR324 cluster bacterium]
MFEELPHGAYNFNVLRGLIEGFQILHIGAGVEIGVFDGGTSWYLLSSFPQLTLLSVDPYKAYSEYDQERLKQAEDRARSRLQPFGERSRLIKATSVEAAIALPDNTFDFVFIDGDHSYEAVREDLKAWYPKVRPGGLFSGHDYRWDSVMRAVDEFAEAHALCGKCSPKESDIWWIIKP